MWDFGEIHYESSIDCSTLILWLIGYPLLSPILLMLSQRFRWRICLKIPGNHVRSARSPLRNTSTQWSPACFCQDESPPLRRTYRTRPTRSVGAKHRTSTHYSLSGLEPFWCTATSSSGSMRHSNQAEMRGHCRVVISTPAGARSLMPLQQKLMHERPEESIVLTVHYRRVSRAISVHLHRHSKERPFQPIG